MYCGLNPGLDATRLLDRYNQWVFPALLRDDAPSCQVTHFQGLGFRGPAVESSCRPESLQIPAQRSSLQCVSSSNHLPVVPTGGPTSFLKYLCNRRAKVCMCMCPESKELTIQFSIARSSPSLYISQEGRSIVCSTSLAGYRDSAHAPSTLLLRPIIAKSQSRSVIQLHPWLRSVRNGFISWSSSSTW